MKTTESIGHIGIVKESKDGQLKINLVNTSACSSCHVKGACAVAQTDNKVIEISGADENLMPGDEVEVTFGPSMEFKALFFGYMFPFLVVLATLIVSLQYLSEAMAGLVALGALIPYYSGIALFSRQLKKSFSFTVRKT